MLPDDVVSALLRAGPEAWGLVMGSRGRGELAGLLLRSVSLAVAARAVCPVIVVRGSGQSRGGALGRVVVGVGDATEGSGAVRFAFRQAKARGGVLTAVRAWRSPAHEHVDHHPPDSVRGDPQIADAAAQVNEERASTNLGEALCEAARELPDVEVHRQPVEGPAQRVLLQASANADLIVIGALRRHGHLGLQLGRVAHALLHHSQYPVAVIPQRA